MLIESTNSAPCNADSWQHPQIRIATWNVERVKPRGWKIAPAQRRRMLEVDADVWVLTETHLDHRPSEGHQGVFCSADPRRPPDERWTAIWSRYPLTPLSIPAPHRRGTLSAAIETPSGPIFVYGTVIDWANEPWCDVGRPAKMWEAHLETIERMDADLTVLRRSHSGIPIFVAGDFNQDRDGSDWYGTQRVRERLTRLLEKHELTCLTADDMVACGKLKNNHLVDHICASEGIVSQAEVLCWERIDRDEVRLSDHPVVAIDF